jgi:uncharacterized membrane protein
MTAVASTPTAPPGHSSGPAGDDPAGEGIAHNVAQIVQLEQRDRLAMSRADHFSNWLAAFSGRVLFAVAHAIFFLVWIVGNGGWLPVKPFDPYPFGLLTVIVSLEAIFLSTFVLISQNQQARLADRRAKVDLQINVLTEQETTRILAIVTGMSRRMNLSVTEAESDAPHVLEQPTDIGEVMDMIDTLEKRLEPDSAKGPDSASDTES